MTMVLLGYASANPTYNFNLDNALGTQRFTGFSGILESILLLIKRPENPLMTP